MCAKERGQENPQCDRLKRDALTLCPTKWIEEWTDDLADGKFVGVPYDEPIFRSVGDDDDDEF